MKQYPVKGEKTYYLKDSDMNFLLEQYMPAWRAKLIGGCVFVERKEIYIREKRRGDIKLLNHERGHLRGYNHTYLPTLMASSWVYRWLNRYYPPYGIKGE